MVPFVFLAPGLGYAGWLDLLNPKTSSNTTSSAAVPTTLAALSQGDVASGLKEALSKGVNQAIASLGKDGGFLNNADVKIPMPPQLHQVEGALRTMGQGSLADEFVATMNHAAEQAVPVRCQCFRGGHYEYDRR